MINTTSLLYEYVSDSTFIITNHYVNSVIMKKKNVKNLISLDLLII